MSSKWAHLGDSVGIFHHNTVLNIKLSLEKSMKSTNDKSKMNHYIGIGAAVGAFFGGILGVLSDNIGTHLGLGIALGVAIGAAVDKNTKN